MARAYLTLAGLILLWVFGIACGVYSLLPQRRGDVRRPKLPVILALVCLLIGVIGLWPPIAYWPRIYYTFELNGAQKTIDSTWFFIVPLLEGAVALAWLIRSRRRSKQEPA